MRPLLDALTEWAERSASWAALDAAFEPAQETPEPSRPATVEEARDLWRAERSKFRSLRIAIRHDHRRRASTWALIEEELTAFRWTWWQFRDTAGDCAGDGAAARREAEELRSRTIARLGAVA